MYLQQERYKLKKDTFGLKPLSMDEYSDIYKATGIDVDDRNMLMNKMFSHSERGIAKYISYAKAIPGFNQLNHDDKMSLITCKLYSQTCLTSHLIPAATCDNQPLPGPPKHIYYII